jgi:hypothetical protein
MPLPEADGFRLCQMIRDMQRRDLPVAADERFAAYDEARRTHRRDWTPRQTAQRRPTAVSAKVIEPQRPTQHPHRAPHRHQQPLRGALPRPTARLARRRE